MARFEYFGRPPRRFFAVFEGSQEPSSSSEIHTVRLPRERRPASYFGQFCTRYCFFTYLAWLRLKLLILPLSAGYGHSCTKAAGHPRRKQRGGSGGTSSSDEPVWRRPQRRVAAALPPNRMTQPQTVMTSVARHYGNSGPIWGSSMGDNIAADCTTPLTTSMTYAMFVPVVSPATKK